MKIDATEVFCWRKMLNVSWTEHRTNSSILRELNTKRKLLSEIQLDILKYFG
jgi:hypothetical protein